MKRNHDTSHEMRVRNVLVRKKIFSQTEVLTLVDFCCFMFVQTATILNASEPNQSDNVRGTIC